MHKLMRTAPLLALILAVAGFVQAQECTHEVEPNDTPAEATPIKIGAPNPETGVPATVCFTGELTSGDQDAFWWEISETAAGYSWVAEIESYRGHLTQLDIVAITFAPNEVDVTAADRLLNLATRGGSRARSREFMVAPGRYLMGISASGGSGNYTVTLHPSEAFPAATTASPRLTGAFSLALDQGAGPHSLTWEVPTADAGPGWRVQVGSALGERVRAALTLDGELLKEETTPAGGSFEWTELDLAAGAYQLELSPGGSPGAPIALTASRSEPTFGVREREPNDTWETANRLPTDEPLSGSLTRNDIDMFTFRSEGPMAEQLYDLVVDTDAVVEVTLYNAERQVLQQRRGAAGALHNLLLEEGEYGFSIAGDQGEYELWFRLAGSVEPGVEREPNDTPASAQTLGEDLSIRGRLSLNDVDMFRFTVPEPGGNYRVQVVGQGSGLERVALMSDDGREITAANAEGGRARISEATLSAGDHLVSVEGSDSEYALRLLNLGEVPEPEAALEARTDDADEQTLEVTTVDEPTPEPEPSSEPAEEPPSEQADEAPSELAGEAAGPPEQPAPAREGACTQPTPREGAGELVTYEYQGSGALHCGEHTNTVVTEDAVMLDPESAAFRFIWVPASNRGTVIKIDTDTGEVVGEYWTAPVYDPDRPSGDPSRTVVDRNGNVWVGMRGDTSENMGSVVKIGLLENGQCEDRNGNGTIDTSTGLGDVRAWTNAGDADRMGGVSTAEDECILEYIRVNSQGIRHVSIGADGNVWVSGTSRTHFDLIDSSTGEIIRTEAAPCGGYGGLVDRAGVLWSARPLMRWDPTEPLSREACLGGTTYGIGLDYNDRVWISDFATGICRYTADGEVDACFDAGEGVNNSRGVGVTPDNHVWMVHTRGNAVTRFAPDGTVVARVRVGNGPTGVSIDARGKPWVISAAEAHRIDPANNRVDMTVNLDGAFKYGSEERPLYDKAKSYVYSDMTGQLVFGPPDSGTYTLKVRGSSFRTSWKEVRYDAEVPEGATLEVRASSSSGLTAGAGLTTLSSGDTIDLEGHYLYIEVSMTRAPNGESPRLTSLEVDATPIPLAPGAIRVEARPDLVASSNAIEVILDASGSMGQLLETGISRWVTATNTLYELADTAFPAGVPVALRVYGHLEPVTCNMALELGLEPFDADSFKSAVASVEPKVLSQTPLAESILAAGDDLADVEGQRMVILITDGEESCGGDPESAILSLRERGIETINIIGFALEGGEIAKEQLDRWAELGGGVYLDTSTGEQLASALNRVLQPEFIVYDPEGAEVGRGRVNSEAVEVPSGVYRVEVLSTPRRLVEGVQVVEREVGLTVALREE